LSRLPLQNNSPNQLDERRAVDPKQNEQQQHYYERSSSIYHIGSHELHVIFSYNRIRQMHRRFGSAPGLREDTMRETMELMHEVRSESYTASANSTFHNCNIRAMAVSV
jgi:hypothetical protein